MSGWLMLHGFTGSPELFHDLGRAGKQPPVLCPWISGHGPTPERSPNFDAELKRLHDLVIGRLVPPVQLLGYSLGARLALGLSLRFPDSFGGAVLVGVNPGLQTAAEREERRKQDTRWRACLEGHGLEAFVASWEAQPLFRTQSALSPVVRARQHQVRLEHTATGLAHALATLGLAEMPNFWPDLGGLELPITLVVGEHDTKFRSLAERMLSQLPKAELAIAPGVGHNVLLEAPRFLDHSLRSYPVDA